MVPHIFSSSNFIYFTGELHSLPTTVMIGVFKSWGIDLDLLLFSLNLSNVILTSTKADNGNDLFPLPASHLSLTSSLGKQKSYASYPNRKKPYQSTYLAFPYNRDLTMVQWPFVYPLLRCFLYTDTLIHPCRQLWWVLQGLTTPHLISFGKSGECGKSWRALLDQGIRRNLMF